MNTKKILTLSAALGLTAASFGVTATTANELCRIEVASGTTNTIVSIALEDVGSTAGTIPLTNLVLTTGLTDGDMILHKTSSGWEAWTLSSGSWTGATVTQENVTTATGSSDALATGGAFWLIRNGSASASFYLYGQVDEVTLASPSRTSGSYTYTMIGNPNLADTALTSLVSTSFTPATGDKIQIPASSGLGVTEYVYSNGWCSVSITSGSSGSYTTADATYTAITDDVTIPAGQGFWYVAAPSSGN